MNWFDRLYALAQEIDANTRRMNQAHASSEQQCPDDGRGAARCRHLGRKERTMEGEGRLAHEGYLVVPTALRNAQNT